MSQFFTSGVAFDSLETVLRIYRRRDLSVEQVLAYFSDETNQQFVKEHYEKLKPITAREALAFANAEQRMAAIRSIPPEEIMQEVNAELVDRQVIQKDQIRWDDNMKPYRHSFKDTYELYKIPTAAFGIRQTNWVKPAIYAVKCNCTSTGRVFYLYVDENAGKAGDAVAAIAWTFRYNGVPLTREQYLNLLYSET